LQNAPPVAFNDSKVLFVPISKDHHFSLVVVFGPNADDQKDQLMVHMDSLKGMKHLSCNCHTNWVEPVVAEGTNCAHKAEEVCKEVMEIVNVCRGRAKENAEFKIHELTVPRQPDFNSCGLFCCTNADFMLSEIEKQLCAGLGLFQDKKGTYCLCCSCYVCTFQNGLFLML
jgi:Ulp1 family protease